MAAGLAGAVSNISGGTTGTFYDSGTVLSLTGATPVADGTGKRWSFGNWTGDVTLPPSTANPVSVTMNQARSITATYTAQYQLTLAITAGVPGGVSNISGGTTGTFYDSGTVLSLTGATPVADGTGKRWSFANWTGDVALPPSTANPVSVTMNQARSITATYTAQYQLTLAITAGVPGGTAANISGGTTGTFYDSGTVLSLTGATPVADGTGKRWSFGNWTGDVTLPPSTANPVSVTMNQARSITATYTAQYQLTLAITAGVPGGVSNISGGTTGTFYDSGTVLSLTGATPVADGTGKRWSFANWTGDVALPPSTANPVSVTMNQARSITATYTAQYQLTLAITAGVPGGTAANISGGTTGTFYDSGTGLSLTAATPVADGAGKRWRFNNWSGDATGGSSPVAVTMSAPRAVTANYVVQFLLTITTNPVVVARTNVTPADGWFDTGSPISLSATSPVAGGAGVGYGF